MTAGIRPSDALTADVERAVGYSITLDAFRRVCTNLQGFGNRLSEEHRTALMELVGNFTLLALGHTKQRLAFPLPTGMGKTQCVIAWLAAVHASGRKEISVAVAATKIEQLCEMREALIHNGVPVDQIGLLHSAKFDTARVVDGQPDDGYASAPSDGDAAADRQILLITHQRVKGGDLRRFNTYRGATRNLLVWDESLIVSDSQALDLRDIRAEFAHLHEYLADTSAAASFFRAVVHAVESESARQATGRAPQRVWLPALSLEARRGVLTEMRHRKAGSYEALRALVGYSDECFSFARTGQGSGLLRYDILVPDELRSVAILDASYPIRQLERMDPTIQLGARFAEGIKRYDDVTIHHLRRATGRDAIQTATSLHSRDERLVNLDVCRLVQRLPVDEGVIVFTYKDRQPTSRQRVGITDRLKSDLAEEGIDLDQTVVDPYDGQTKPRFVFLTWGSEIAC